MKFSSVERYKELCQKNDAENYLFDKYVYRKLSIYVTIIFIKLGIKANQATFISLLAALGSLYFLSSNSPPMMVTAALLISAYYMLDHVDGELARYYLSRGMQQPSLSGQYFDVLIHKYSSNLMLFFLGLSVYRLFGNPLPVILGIVSFAGMSSFPNLIAAHVLTQKIANSPEALDDEKVMEALYRIEKKQEQISRIKSKNLFYTLKKIVSEMFFFPGCLLLITGVVILDIFIPNFTVSGYDINLRFLLLIALTPVYVLNTLRQSGKWLALFARIR